jgi:hypothetical protein
MVRRLWLIEPDASRFIGRSGRTIRNWRRMGLVECKKYRGNWAYEKDSLRWARDESRRRMMALPPGPGRHRGLDVNQDALFEVKPLPR